ncbi:protein containing Radical SAM domain protein [human gut metagenome]|uniref:Protein containing Radical SAM domain protein n=1 Tax=human gut metagenome TaxID=408170 RepID=K1SHP4_9ZZZZ
MKLEIRNKEYEIKPYACSPCNEFPFYINVTNICNAKCDFCSNACNKDYGKLDLEYLKEILDKVSDKVSRFSISGGETLINPKNLEELLKLLHNYDRRITMNTNGSFLLDNIDMLNKYPNIESIQLSRHHYEDDKNNEVFKINTLSFEDLKKIKANADLRINCLLIKNYIDSKEEIVKFLEKISETDISQVGFISMMQVNDFTKENFVDYRAIISSLNDDFLETKKMAD